MRLLDFHSDILKLIICDLDNLSQIALKLSCGRMFPLVTLKMNKTILCIQAASFGRLDLLKWLKLSDRNIETICCNASVCGHLNVLKWLKLIDRLSIPLVCANAAFNGKSNILQWIRKNRIPFYEGTMDYAARNGDVLLMKWLINNECPWGDTRASEGFYSSDVNRWLTKCGRGDRNYIDLGLPPLPVLPQV